MEDLRRADRQGRGPVLAWRRWQLGLAFAGLVVGVVLVSGDPETGSGARAPLARDELGAPVWTLARAGGSGLASSTTRGDVWLKDLASGRMLRLQEGRRGFALSLASSPDGRILAVATGRAEVRIYDARRGLELEPMDAGVGPVRAVAFSPDGTTLAAGAWEPTRGLPAVTLWEWPGRRRIAALDGHRVGLTAMAFSPDGSRLVTADSGGVLRLWDATDATPRILRQSHLTGIITIAFAPDGRLFATSSHVDGAVRLWDANDGEPRGSLPDVANAATSLDFSPDGTLLAMAQGGEAASLREVASGREAGSVRVATGCLQTVAFSGDGGTLATGSLDGSVRLWDVARALDGDSRGDTPTPRAGPSALQ